MTYLHQYVPTVKHCDNSSGSQFIPSDQVQFHSILVGGDQLTAARARGAIKHMMNALTPAARLEGLILVTEDWHTKVALLGVSYKQ